MLSLKSSGTRRSRTVLSKVQKLSGTCNTNIGITNTHMGRSLNPNEDPVYMIKESALKKREFNQNKDIPPKAACIGTK